MVALILNSKNMRLSDGLTIGTFLFGAPGMVNGQPGLTPEALGLCGNEGARHAACRNLSEDEVGAIRDGRERANQDCFRDCDEEKAKTLPGYNDGKRLPFGSEEIGHCRQVCNEQTQYTYRPLGQDSCDPKPANLTPQEAEAVCAARVNDTIKRAAEPTKEPDPMFPNSSGFTVTRPNWAFTIEGGSPFDVQDQMHQDCMSALGQ